MPTILGPSHAAIGLRGIIYFLWTLPTQELQLSNKSTELPPYHKHYVAREQHLSLTTPSVHLTCTSYAGQLPDKTLQNQTMTLLGSLVGFRFTDVYFVIPQTRLFYYGEKGLQHGKTKGSASKPEASDEK